MTKIDAIETRRTSADIVFDTLYKQIIGLEIMPGTKMSEDAIAKQFGLSRQPVREAFGRLNNMGLLQVRPQRPTVVRHFSLSEIQNARFIRRSVEVEVLRLACLDRDVSFDHALHENLDRQKIAQESDDLDAFHRLDYEFHELLCKIAGKEFAFETISQKKAQVDRLGFLSLTNRSEMLSLLNDHIEIFEGVISGDTRSVDTAIRRHLDRLSPTIAKLYESHRDYFED